LRIPPLAAIVLRLAALPSPHPVSPQPLPQASQTGPSSKLPVQDPPKS
jgi:hypothetical protein